MSTTWSAFLSYRTHRATKVAPLLRTLASAGIHLLRDEERIAEGASIGESVRRGLVGSSALLV